MKIALVSDTHFCGQYDGHFGAEAHMELARRMHAERPDVLVISGDVAETNVNPSYLGECLDTYKNPHGYSVMVPGNHDVWCSNTNMEAEQKYLWNLETAIKRGWIPLSDRPVDIDGTWFAGNMGWYDFGCCPKYLGFPPEYYEKRRAWSDYRYMCLTDPSIKSPMKSFCRRRMSEFRKCLGAVPSGCRPVVVTHIVGFRELLGGNDENTAYFGNLSIGREVLKRKAILYMCGHTHHGVDVEIRGTRCVNNGSDYGRKDFTLIEL